MTNKILATSTIGAVLALMMLSPNFVFADSSTNHGSTPNGKPFQYVQGQISTIQSQIDALKAQVTTINGELAADKQAITLLQNDITSLNGQVSALQAQSGDNSQEINFLQDEIFQDQVQIGQLQGEINGINTEIQFKQNVINGVCPPGSAVISVDHSGSLVCGTTGGTLQTAFAYNAETISPDSLTTIIAQCPAGYIASGGGYLYDTLSTIEFDGPLSPTVWGLGIYNTEPFSDSNVVAIADCLKS